jgi:hypothetical protein
MDAKGSGFHCTAPTEYTVRPTAPRP